MGFRLHMSELLSLPTDLLNTNQCYKRQGHAPFKALCWLFCPMVESRNNGRTTQTFPSTVMRKPIRNQYLSFEPNPLKMNICFTSQFEVNETLELLNTLICRESFQHTNKICLITIFFSLGLLSKVQSHINERLLNFVSSNTRARVSLNIQSPRRSEVAEI